MNGLRIVCDLSDFFHDFRQKSMMFIDYSKDRVIEDVITRIKNQLLVNENKIVLLVGEYFLPCSEDVRILRDGDIIKVTRDVQTNSETIVSTKKLSEADLRNIYTSKTSVGRTLNHQELVGDVRKLKSCPISNILIDIPFSARNGLDSNESEKKQTAFNNQSSTEIIPGMDISQPVSVLEVHNVVLSVQELNEKEAEKSNTDHSVDENASHSTDNDLKSRKKARKRIRKRKRKDISEDPQPQPPSLLRQSSTEIIPGMDIPQPVSVLEVHNVVLSVQELNEKEAEKSNTDYSVDENASHSTDNDLKSRKKARKRIRKRKRKDISEDPQPQPPSLLRPAYMKRDTSCLPFDTSSKQNPNHIRFSNEDQSPDNDLNNDNNTSDFNGRTTNNNVGLLTLPSKPANTQWDVTSTAKVVDTFSSYRNNDQPFDKILALGNATPIVAKRKRPEKVFADNSVPVAASTSLLDGPPKENDVIMYKILKLDESYCPQISGHITAKVLHYAAGTQQLSLEILDGIDHCRQPKGKFDLAADYDMETDIDDNFIEVNWQELLDAHKCIM